MLTGWSELGCSGPAGTPTAPEPVKHSGNGGGGVVSVQYFTPHSTVARQP